MSENDILAHIAAYKSREIEAAKAATSIQTLEAAARGAPPPRGFRAALKRARAAGRPGLIAEIKKASPSKGIIRPDFDPPALARAYEKGGASCLSVLTDGPSFQGAGEYLIAARSATSLPVLRKDFMLEPYQIVESRALGADCILVIMAMVDDPTAAALIEAANIWGMDALVEVHEDDELRRALALGTDFIGINNRNLKTFVTDIATSITLSTRIPKNCHVVAESGLSTSEDLALLMRSGVSSFLIGESLMRKADVELATRNLLTGVTT